MDNNPNGINPLFNRSSFNLATFNVGSGELWLSVNMEEFVNGYTTPGKDLTLRASGAEVVKANASGEGCYFISVTGAETVSAAAAGEIFFAIAANMASTVTAQAGISSETEIKVSGASAVSALSSISMDLHLSVDDAEVVSAASVIASEVKTSASGGELVSATASLEATDEFVCVLTITLAPGQRLIIDANSYNVYLDGENVIWCHSGDWIDELTRDTESISFLAESGAAGISASMVYTERYL